MNLKTTEAIRAAAEAVGEYLQAPPSMWNTIERLIAQQTTATLSAHNTQIREVLEGLRFRHGCWCELPPNITSPDHTCECDAARELWERVQG